MVGTAELGTAEAEAEAALQKLGAALKQPGTTTKVAALQLLGDLGLDVLQHELEDDIVADVGFRAFASVREWSS